jgi:hypothetical protein
VPKPLVSVIGVTRPLSSIISEEIVYAYISPGIYDLDNRSMAAIGTSPRLRRVISMSRWTWLALLPFARRLAISNTTSQTKFA